MFKALYVASIGSTFSIDTRLWNQWIESVYQFIIESNGYRVSTSQSNKKTPTITIVDPFIPEKSYSWLTDAGMQHYSYHLGFITDWLTEQAEILGIPEDQIPTFIEALMREITVEVLTDPTLKTFLRTHHLMEQLGIQEFHKTRLKRITQSIITQSTETGLEPLFFVSNKFHLYYELGGELYRIPPDAVEAALKDPKQLIAKEFVDFSG